MSSALFDKMFKKGGEGAPPNPNPNPNPGAGSGAPNPNPAPNQPDPAAQAKAENEQLKQRLQALENENKQLKNQPPPNPNSNPAPSAPISVLEDEDAAFAQRQAPVIVAALSANAQVAAMRAENSIMQGDSTDAKLYRRFKADVDRLFAAQPLQSQADPQVYMACFERILGNKRGEINKLRGTADDPFVETVGGPAPLPANTNASVLTDEEKRIAKRMGISEEKYLKNKKEAVLVA